MLNRMITDSFVISLTTLALCQGIFSANYFIVIYNDGNEEIGDNLRH